MSESDIILYNVKGKVAWITLNRPEMAHSFNWELMNALWDALRNADGDEKVRCIILESTGDKVFSAGIDIKATTPDDLDYMKKMREIGRRITEYMLLMKKPIIAKVQGTAIGYGMELVMACDLRLFADKPIEEMFFRMPEIAISIYPQTGATILPLLAFGLNYAKQILFTADKFGLEELKNLNFPTRVFPPDDLDKETRKFIRTFSKRDHGFTFLIKSTLTLMNNKMIERWYDLEDECGKVAYEKRTMKELDDYIKDLFQRYP